MGGGREAFPERTEAAVGSRARSRRQVHGMVRTRTRRRRQPDRGGTSRMAAQALERSEQSAVRSGQPRSAQLDVRAYRRPDREKRHRLLSSGLQHAYQPLLGRSRRARPGGHPRNPARRGPVRLLGLSARTFPGPADRQLRGRRTASRSGDHVAQRLRCGGPTTATEK